MVDGGAEILFYTSHAVSLPKTIRFIYEFEHGKVTYDLSRGNVMATFSDGSQIDYGRPEEHLEEKLWCGVESARTGARPLCGISAAAVHVQCVLEAQKHAIREFPAERILSRQEGGYPQRYVSSLAEKLTYAFQNASLPPFAGL